MEIIRIFNEKGKEKDFALSSWYCRPAILKCLAYRLKKDLFPSLLFICCSKYGCRQFLPVFSKSFPVHNLDWIAYKNNLDWCVIEFNDNAK